MTKANATSSVSATFKTHGTIERAVRPGTSSGRVFVPKSWIGKRVCVLLLEPADK